jgi:hypothetical protein
MSEMAAEYKLQGLWAPTPTSRRMSSGRWFDVAVPMSVDIDLEDVVLGLSRLTRWSGQTLRWRAPVSVLAHSLVVAETVLQYSEWPRTGDEWPNWRAARAVVGLAHDIHEVFLGDVCRPVEAALSAEAQQELRRLRDRIDSAVTAWLGPVLSIAKSYELIRWADDVAGYVEARLFFDGQHCPPWPETAPPRVKALWERISLSEFLKQYEQNEFRSCGCPLRWYFRPIEDCQRQFRLMMMALAPGLRGPGLGVDLDEWANGTVDGD